VTFTCELFGDNSKTFATATVTSLVFPNYEILS